MSRSYHHGALAEAMVDQAGVLVRGSMLGAQYDRPERPRLNLQPRSAPREDRAPPEAKDDDGFATVQRKR